MSIARPGIRMPRVTRRWKPSLRRCCTAGLALWAAAAAASDLDSGFGAGGATVTPIDGFATVGAMLRQADGKLVVAGSERRTNRIPEFQSFLVRYSADGTLDTSFGVDGKLGGFGLETALAIAQEADGTLVVAGSGTHSSGTGRVPAIALIDGGLSVRRYDTLLDSVATAVAVQSDGKLVLALSGGDRMLLRVLPTVPFSADTGFGENGVVPTQGESSNSLTSSRAVLVQPDGKIVVGGLSTFGTSGSVARVLADGTPDFGFGVNGVRGVPEHADAAELLLQPDGKIVVASPGGQSFRVARLLGTTGALDASFGTNGQVATAILGSARPGGLVLQEDGKLTVAGRAMTDVTDQRIALARYRVDGSADESFAPGGVLTRSVAEVRNVVAAVLQSSGRLVVAGDAQGEVADDHHALIARFHVGGPADLALGTAADLDAVKSGGPLIYTHTVRNYGPDTGYDVVLTNTVPPGTVFTSATASQGTCETPPIGGTGTVVCRLGKVFDSAQAPATLRVRVTARGGSALTNSASVAGSGADGNTANNSTTLQTRVSGSRK
jgi:uncharacterized delta-60 repeat protein/uncharacterized repeat protein (TIGR01451 family)